MPSIKGAQNDHYVQQKQGKAWINGQNGVQFLLCKYQFRRLISHQCFHICFSVHLAHWRIGNIVTKWSM